MSIRYLGPIAAFVISTMLCGCFTPAANPTAAADNQHVVRRNLDGSTTQGVEVIANYNGKRVFTLQADPMGGALGVGQDVGRGVRSLTTPAQAPHSVAQSLNAPAAVVQSVDPCAPSAQGHWHWVPAE